MVATSNSGFPLPPRAGTKHPQVTWPTVSKPLCGVFLANSFEGHYVHWIVRAGKARSVGCLMNDRCPHCLSGLDCKWTGYACWWDLRQRKEQIVVLTYLAATQLLPKLEDGLRGLGCTMRRTQDKNNGKVVLEFHGKKEDFLLPPAFDMIPTLCWLWGISPDTYKEAQRYARATGVLPPLPEDNMIPTP